MVIIIETQTTPSNPSSGFVSEYFDSANSNKKTTIDSNGVKSILTHDGLQDQNIIMNGGIMIQQRYAPSSVAIAGVSTTTRAGVVADRWAVTTSVAANLNWQQVDTIAARESSLSSRYYGSIIASTAGKKVMLSQFVPAKSMAHLGGTKVRVQFKIKQKVGTAGQTYRMGLLQLNSSGTVDVSPAFLTGAWSAVTSTDPTWGTNLQPITPDASPTGDGGTITGNYLNVTTTAGWTRASCVFSVPSDAKNLVIVIFADATGGTTDNISFGEIGMYQGSEIRDWVEEDFTQQLLKCQAFYCKTFAYGTTPVAGAGAATGEHKWHTSITTTGANRSGVWNFPVTMWKSPTTVTLFGVTTTTTVRDITAGADGSVGTIVGTTDRGTAVTGTGNAGSAVGNIFGIHFTADAEIVA